MNISKTVALILVAAAGVLAMAGCKQKSAMDPAPQAGAAEQAGAALDRAAEKTEAGAEQAVEKAGEALEATGAAVEQTGEDLQN